MAQQTHKPFCLEVWGDYACFTRPEMKVERVSYDVPTPSAVRAIFEAILWKPAIRWQVNKIEVLNPIKWVSIRRNEVGSLISERNNGIFIEDSRQQRAGIFLKDVHYRFYATLQVLANKYDRDKTGKVGPGEGPGKYPAMFERRAMKGQCFNQPYLGCREFSCGFRLVSEETKMFPQPIAEDRDLGFMLFDMDFSDPQNPWPMFFRAKIENGVINIPAPESDEVKK